MNKKVMLITGASRGIGWQLATDFAEDYDIVSVARTGNVTFKGDLSDRSFLEIIPREFPKIDVLVNNVGVIDDDLSKTLATNFLCATFLMDHYYQTMPKGHIINIGSNIVYETGYVTSLMDRKLHYYMASKKALEAFSYGLANSEANPEVKISQVDPEFVSPGMNGILNENVASRVELMEASDITPVVRWILNQPDHMRIQSLHIKNKRKFRNPDWPSANLESDQSDVSK